MPKYEVGQETDIWGNDKTVIRSRPTSYEVGSAVGTGLALVVAARRNSQMKAIADAMATAQRQVENHNFEAALATCNTLIANKDREAQTVGHYFKAMAFYGLDRYDEAASEATAALDLAQRLNQAEALNDVYLMRGMCYYRSGQLAGALKDLATYIQVKPNEDMGYYYQGLALLQLGDVEQAITTFSKAINLNPDAANYRERARAYAQHNELDKAIDDFTRAITLDPNDGYCYQLRANLYEQKNDHAHAIADHSRAIELAPDNMESYKRRAALYQQTGDTAKSAADLALVSREQPLQNAYNQYAQAAKTAYDNGVRGTYTQADTMTQPNWGLAIVQIVIVAIVGFYAMSFCGNFATSVREQPLGISLLIVGIMLALAWGVIAGVRSNAKNKVNAATAYLQMIGQNEPRMPGFADFFAQYLQARSASRLQDLPKTTRAFFESGPGSRVVQQYIAGSQPA